MAGKAIRGKMTGANTMNKGAIQRVFECRDQVFATGDILRHHINIAGQRVTLHFKNPAIAERLTPAMQHLPTTGANGQGLDIYVWDAASTGVSIPTPPKREQPNQGWQYDKDGLFGLQVPYLGCHAWLDRAAGDAVYWVEQVSDITIAEESGPFIYVLAAWMAHQNLHVIHAAALEGTCGAALLVGRGGTGKSSTALAALQSSLGYLSDDYCLVQLEPTPRVNSLYNTGKVFHQDTSMYPFLDEDVIGSDPDKTMYHFIRTHADHLRISSPLTKLVALSRTGAKTSTITRISPMEAIKKVAPNTLLQIRCGVDPRSTLDAMVQLAKTLDCYELNMGPDRFEVISTLENVLSP